MSWERSIARIDLSMNAIKAMISNYDSKSKVEEFNYLAGGCINHNYKVSLSSGENLLLRIVHEETSFKNEIAIGNSILKDKINIPKIYSSGVYSDYMFIIYQFIDGTILTDALKTGNRQSYIQQAAKSAAIIHSHEKEDIEGMVDISSELPPFFIWYEYFMSDEKVIKHVEAHRINALKQILT